MFFRIDIALRWSAELFLYRTYKRLAAPQPLPGDAIMNGGLFVSQSN